MPYLIISPQDTITATATSNTYKLMQRALLGNFSQTTVLAREVEGDDIKVFSSNA